MRFNASLRTVHQPSPAIVSQDGVRRLPRWGLLLFCVIYALAGFFWRDPWKRDDITSFGYMLELAQGNGNWLNPGLLGESAHFNALIPYWLGAWAIQCAPAWITPSLAVRLVFAALLFLTMLATWYAVYYLARSRRAQPVSFAFGGEAKPADYARAVADGGILALLACLGLAQPAHETAPALVQLCSAALLLFGLAALPYRARLAAAVGSLGMLGLTLSGAPTIAVLLGTLGLLVHGTGHATDWVATHSEYEQTAQELQRLRRRRWCGLMGIVTLLLLSAVLASWLDLWRWRIDPPPMRWVPWRNWIRMHLWFCWPVWPFTLWTLWGWRHQWRQALPSRHIALPLGMIFISTLGTLLTNRNDTLLLLALPAYAALAAFALPTFRRSVGAFVDWFSLILFSLAGSYIWFVWIAAVTGVPERPAARVYRMLEGFTPRFKWGMFLLGLLATLAWGALVRWRTMRLRPAIWKSMILPAGGVGMCWVLLTSLWLPALNYTKSYVPVARSISHMMGAEQHMPACVQVYALEDAQITALMYYSKLPLTRNKAASCPWLLTHEKTLPILPHVFDMQQWQQQGVVRRPGDKNDAIAVFARTTHTSPNARNSSEAGKDDSHSASTAVNASTNADTSANAASGAASASSATP